MILVLDNYDSFTFNLVHDLLALGVEVEVRRNDAIDIGGVRDLAPDAVVISPGPSTPDRAGLTLRLVQHAVETGLPLLGVCLGHQAIGQALGGRVVRAGVLMHGKVSAIRHDGTGVFAGLASPLVATRYHSLVVDPATLPPELVANAWADDPQGPTLMGVRHADLPIHGVQFHPESIATQAGHRMLAAFLDAAGVAHGPVPIRQALDA